MSRTTKTITSMRLRPLAELPGRRSKSFEHPGLPTRRVLICTVLHVTPLNLCNGRIYYGAFGRKRHHLESTAIFSNWQLVELYLKPSSIRVVLKPAQDPLDLRSGGFYYLETRSDVRSIAITDRC